MLRALYLFCVLRYRAAAAYNTSRRRKRGDMAAMVNIEAA